MDGLGWKGNQDVEQCFPWKFSFSISTYICFQSSWNTLFPSLTVFPVAVNKMGKWHISLSHSLSYHKLIFHSVSISPPPLSKQKHKQKDSFFLPADRNSFNPSFIILCLGPTSLFFTFIIFIYNKASQKLPITKMYCWNLLRLLLLLLAVNMNQFKLFKSGT